MKYLERIQVLLPLGYLYLIILGLLKQSVQYYQLGINIVSYSSITDILISPISDMTSTPGFIIVIILFSIFLMIIQALLVKNSHKTWAQKILGENRFNPETSKKEMRKFIFPFIVLILAFELLAVFIGFGIAGGNIISKHIKQNDFTCNYKVNFNSGKVEEVYIFDLNSSYYFYATKGSKNIKIAPVASIGGLELIDNKKLK